jgi:predicted MFS family arabinose efflux permease
VLLDRFGSRRVNATLLLVAAGGCLVFAGARSAWMLWVSRAMIGVGVSAALMASLRAFRFWYVPARQQQLTAWMLVAGSLGALATTVPVQMALPAIGWRGVFAVSALLLVATSLAIFFLLPADEPIPARHGRESSWGAYRQVFCDRYFWRFGVVSLTVMASFVAFQGLWIGPWLRRVLGMDADEAATALFVFNLVLMLGYLGLGLAVPHLVRRGWTTLRMVTIGTTLMLLLELAIALSSGNWAWLLWIALAVAATCHSLSQTHVSLSFPERLTGRAFTAYNLLTMSGMFVAQWLFGVAVDFFGGEHDGIGFRPAMLLWVAMQALALAVLAFWNVQPRQDAAVKTS